MRAAKIVLCEVDLRMVEPNVRVIRKREANAVIKGENEFATRHVVLQPLRYGQRRGRFLAAAHAQQPLRRRSTLRSRRTAERQHQRDRKQGTEHVHPSPPRNCSSNWRAYS